MRVSKWRTWIFATCAAALTACSVALADTPDRFVGQWKGNGTLTRFGPLTIVKDGKFVAFAYHTWQRQNWCGMPHGNTVRLTRHMLPAVGDPPAAEYVKYYIMMTLTADGKTLTVHQHYDDGPKNTSDYNEVLYRVPAPPSAPDRRPPGTVKPVYKPGCWYLVGVGVRVGPFESLHRLPDGQYAGKSGGKFRVFDRSGRQASSFAWTDIQAQGAGRYAGKEANGDWRLLNLDGSPVSTYAWERIKSDPDGLKGLSRGVWKAIDRNGRPR